MIKIQVLCVTQLLNLYSIPFVKVWSILFRLFCISWCTLHWFTKERFVAKNLMAWWIFRRWYPFSVTELALIKSISGISIFNWKQSERAVVRGKWAWERSRSKSFSARHGFKFQRCGLMNSMRSLTIWVSPWFKGTDYRKNFLIEISLDTKLQFV